MSARSRKPAARKCVVCGKPQSGKYRPFCSQRCADIDLARWLGGRYAIPGRDSDDAPASNGEGEDAADDG